MGDLKRETAEVLAAARAVLGELVEDIDGLEGGALLPTTKGKVMTIEELHQMYGRHVWELHEKNYTAAAEALGVSQNTLRYTYLEGGAGE